MYAVHSLFVLQSEFPELCLALSLHQANKFTQVEHSVHLVIYSGEFRLSANEFPKHES